MANDERPIIQRPNVDPPRPMIQRPNVDPPRPTIQRPTVDTGRPMIQRPTVDTDRPMIQRPNVEERPTIERPTIDTQRPNITPPAASPAQRPAPTPTQVRQDTGSHPARKVGRLAHVMKTHQNNALQNAGRIYNGPPGGKPLSTEGAPKTEMDMQFEVDFYRDRNKGGYEGLEEDVQNAGKLIGASFKNRHNKDYGYEDL